MPELGTEPRVRILRGHPECGEAAGLWGRRGVCGGAAGRAFSAAGAAARRGRVHLTVSFGASDSASRGLWQGTIPVETVFPSESFIFFPSTSQLVSWFCAAPLRSGQEAAR